VNGISQRRRFDDVISKTLLEQVGLFFAFISGYGSAKLTEITRDLTDRVLTVHRPPILLTTAEVFFSAFLLNDVCTHLRRCGKFYSG